MEGDINRDGTLSVADVSALLEYISGGSDNRIDTESADMNGDGVVNIGDVSLLLSIL